jgi:hypothetical protein
MALQNIWDEDLDKYCDNYMRFEIYSQPAGFKQWKTDGEWLMSHEFVEELIAGQGEPKTMNATLLGAWIGKGRYTRAFGEGVWEEGIRDSAIPFMERMIELYQAKVNLLQDGDFKTYMLSVIEDLMYIKRDFGEAIDYRFGDDIPIIIEKATGNILDPENGRMIVGNGDTLNWDFDKILTLLPNKRAWGLV